VTLSWAKRFSKCRGWLRLGSSLKTNDTLDGALGSPLDGFWAHLAAYWDKMGYKSFFFVHRSGSVTRSFGTHSLGQAPILFARWKSPGLSGNRFASSRSPRSLYRLEERSLPDCRQSSLNSEIESKTPQITQAGEERRRQRIGRDDKRSFHLHSAPVLLLPTVMRRRVALPSGTLEHFR